ncbi:hypothetical protein IWX90DRAFT_488729 [Phyllosticta citrichinensis]|uniref:BHLH domain-containing protein n=1 Tax=Phyllosticta citrichinensis TaxID=1130410 RepID=A0ABR1XKG1_9PEZI
MSASASALAAEIPSFSEADESQRSLRTIQHVGINNILDKDVQPRERSRENSRARIDEPDVRILSPEEYPYHFLLALERLVRLCDDLAQLKLLIRRRVDCRNSDARYRTRCRLAREALTLDLDAVHKDLCDEREDDVSATDRAAQDTSQRKRPADSPIKTVEQQANAKKPRMNFLEQDDELDGDVHTKQEEEQGDGQYIKQEGEQECGLRYVLEYAPGGQDIDQEDIKQEEERCDDQNDDDPQYGELSAQISKKTRSQRGKANRSGKARKEQEERRERRVEYARRTANILSAYTRHDTLSKDFDSTAESSWILRLLQSQVNRLGEIRRLLDSSEQDREPQASKLAAHLTASSALSEGTRNLEGNTKWDFLKHHVLDMQDDRTHLEHKAVVLETSIRKLFEFTKEKNYRLWDVEASVLEVLS